MFLFKTVGYIKSPLNYIGGKYKLLPQILPLFPNNINQFIDLFVGGANVALNVEAKKIICNDNLYYLIELYKAFNSTKKWQIFDFIDERICELELSLYNEIGFKKLRDEYNNRRNPLDLFLLIAYSFNHQIRFNSQHNFNTPFGRDRSSYNYKMQENLDVFLTKLEMTDVDFQCNNFNDFDFSVLGKNDFIYCDPPYLIATGTYNDGKRGFTGWNKEQEILLLKILSELSYSNIKFALSNVLEHKGIINEILYNWIRENSFNVHYLQKSYKNSNYQTKNIDKGQSLEVLITNY